MRDDNMWAIQRISDGKLLPSSRSHASYVEFDDGTPPRLFMTKPGAHAALRNWAMGFWATTKEWEATDEYGGGFYYQGLPCPIGKGMRDVSQCRIVKVNLQVVS
jgi:hypothetical protein